MYSFEPNDWPIRLSAPTASIPNAKKWHFHTLLLGSVLASSGTYAYSYGAEDTGFRRLFAVDSREPCLPPLSARFAHG